jgi:hypothetical protein
MTPKRSIFIASLCGLALVGAGCGDDEDNKALSYDDTGTRIGEICDTVKFDGLTGKPANDAPILEDALPDFEKAIQDVRALEVAEELETDRDAFADNAEQQVAIIKEAQQAAESGDAKAYRETIEEAQPLDKESDAIASRLGAIACTEDDE